MSKWLIKKKLLPYLLQRDDRANLFIAQCDTEVIFLDWVLLNGWSFLFELHSYKMMYQVLSGGYSNGWVEEK